MSRGVYRVRALGLGVLGGAVMWRMNSDSSNLYLRALGGSSEAGRMLQVLCFLGVGLLLGLIHLLWREERGGFWKTSLAVLILFGAAAALYLPTVYRWSQHDLAVWRWLGFSMAGFLPDWLVHFLYSRRTLAGPSSPLRWRGTLPEMALPAVLLLITQLCLRGADMDGALYLLLFLWPFLAAAVGFALGRRCGVTPLFPPAVLVCALPNRLFLADGAQLAAVYGALALTGNLAGAGSHGRR